MNTSGQIESLEDPVHYRLFINPDPSDPVFKAYKKAQESFWVEEEIDSELKKDSDQWKDMDPGIQHLIIHQIAFFLIGDGRVNQTISDHIDSRITNREVLLWYNFQKMMEDIHNIVYVKLADTYIRNPQERIRIFNCVENYPVIGKKINWLKKWLGEGNDIHKLDPETIETIKKLKNFYLGVSNFVHTSESGNKSDQISKLDQTGRSDSRIPEEFSILFNKLEIPRPSLAKQIFINIVMEGLFFQGSFCIIFWVNHQYGKLPGLTKANEFISRDEATHYEFGVNLFNRMQFRPSQKWAHDIISEAVELEIEHMSEGLPNNLLNMNIGLMSQYLKFVADKILQATRFERIYNTTNPFSFMDKQSVSVRISDFFIDNNVSEYGHHASGTNPDEQNLCFDGIYD